MTAKLIKSNLDGFRGNASLYEMDPPHEGHKYVVVSSVVADFTGSETLLFPSNKKGDIDNWSELDGSRRGTLDHEEVLTEIGRKII